MSYTFWLACPKQMLFFGVHPFNLFLDKEDTTTLPHHQKIFETINESCTGTNILVSGKCLCPDKIMGLILCTQQNNRSHFMKRRTHMDIFMEEKDVFKFVQLFCQTLLGKLYVTGDKIFLKSARAWAFALKFSLVLQNSEVRRERLDILLDVAIACYIAALTNVNIYEGLKNTATSITETAATNTATLGIESAAQVVGNAVAGAAISAIVDVAVSSAMIYVAKRQKDEGRISEEEYSIRVKKTVCESSCKFVGGTTGSILGQAFIPVPVVGAFVGGFCGSLIGAGIGKGINYGVFDRKTKKTNSGGRKVRDEVTKRHIYGRRFRGYVPKIIVYNERAKEFQEKHFQKTIKNYFKPESQQQNSIGTQAIDNANEAVKPYINLWRNKALPKSDQNTMEKKVVEKQLFVLSKWKSRRPRTPDPAPAKTFDGLLGVEKGEKRRSLSDPSTITEFMGWRKQTTPRTPSPSSADKETFLSITPNRRDSVKDRLSPTQLIQQVKNNLTKTKSSSFTENEELPNTSPEENSAPLLPSSPLETSLPQNNSTAADLPPNLFHRLSIKSIKDTFRTLGSPSQKEEFDSPTKEEIEFLKRETDDDEEEEVVDGGCNVEEQREEEQRGSNRSQSFTSSSFSRIKSFHSSIKIRNRDKMKFPGLSIFNTIDAEGNVYNNRNSPSEGGNGDGGMSCRKDMEETAILKEKISEGEHANEPMNISGFTNKLLSFANTRRRSSTLIEEDFDGEQDNQTGHCSDNIIHDPNNNNNNDNNDNNNDSDNSDDNSRNNISSEQRNPTSTMSSSKKSTFFNSSLSSSISENSSSCNSPSGISGGSDPASCGSDPVCSFSEREFDWWNRKLRHRFEHRTANEEKPDACVLTSGEYDEQNNNKDTTEDGGDQSKTPDRKKDRKLFSTLKSFTKKFR